MAAVWWVEGGVVVKRSKLKLAAESVNAIAKTSELPPSVVISPNFTRSDSAAPDSAQHGCNAESGGEHAASGS